MNEATMHTAEVATREDFLGLPFVSLDMAQAVAAVRRASQDAEWRYVVTPNAAHLARLSEADPALQSIYENAHLCFLDSRVISLAARLIGLRPPQVIPGADLVEHLFRHAITPLTPICLVGGGDAVVNQIKKCFNINKICHINPSMGFLKNQEEFEQTAAFIVASRADYTFLVVGSPQQEFLAARVATMRGARGVGICAGASIDFITGVKRRAPLFLQRMALEWAFRLCMEPRRLAYRYTVEGTRGLLFVLRKGFR